jgi:outer membrane protein insertion porin family
MALGLAAASGPARQPADPPVPLPDAPADSALAALENLPIRTITIQAPAGSALSDLARQRAVNNIRSFVGGAYRADTVDADARRLNRLGVFARVDTFARPTADNAVELIFELVERPIIRDVQAAGNTRVTDQQLAQQVDLLIGTPIDRFQIDRAARRIEDLYRERGYYFAQVTIDEELLGEQGIVLFRVREGERVKVTDIRFEGAVSFNDRQLRRELETKQANLFRRGQLDDDKLDQDIGNLINFYRDRGFLDIRADRRITPSPDSREAIVTYLIDEGPRYLLRSIRFEVEPNSATPVYTQEQIAALVPLKPGDAFGATPVRDAIDSVRKAYWQLGHADVSVRSVEQRDPDEPLVDVVVIVAENAPSTTGEIIIQGNQITQQRVIRREIDLRPDRPLDRNALDRSAAALQRTRLFDPNPPDRGVKITLQPPDPADPEYRDVLVEVEETRTGEVNFGGAVSSDAGVVGRISLTQRNFDVTDFPDSWSEFVSGRAFRGAGQTFQAEALPGDQVQTYSLGLSDPALFDSDYSGSATVFYRERDFTEFDEQRYGTRLSLGRRFGTRWNGSLTGRIESVELSDLAPDRPTDVFDVADQNVLTTLGASLTRSTLDNFFRPSTGTRTRFSVEQAVGDFNYSKLNAEHRYFIPIRQDYLGRDTVLSLGTEIGYVPQSEDDIPTYERFYLGGQSLRGFDFRTVSPKGIRNDTLGPSDDSVGGTWLFFLGAEVQQPIFEELLSVVAFVDSGTVTNDPGLEDYRVSVGFGFRLWVPQLSPAPLAFDFGFPVVKEDTDESRLFTFSIDLPF